MDGPAPPAVALTRPNSRTYPPGMTLRHLRLALVLAGGIACLSSCRARPLPDQLVIRESLATGGREIARSADAAAVRQLYALLQSAVETPAASPSDGKPARQMEFFRGDTLLETCEYPRYWPGSTMLVFRRNGHSYSLFVVKIQDWCRGAGMDFQRLFVE